MNKWKPNFGETYYMPDMFFNGKEDILVYIWSDSELDSKRYEAGIICHTKEEAIELSDKMLMVTKKHDWIIDENSNPFKEYWERLEDDHYTCGSLFDCQEFWFIMMFISFIIILCFHYVCRSF